MTAGDDARDAARDAARDGTARDRTARDDVLARIRAAFGPDPRRPAPVPRAYRRAGTHAPGSGPLLDLLTDRLEDYRATVRRCAPDRLAAAVAEALTGHGAARVAVPGGLDPGWLAAWPGTVLRDAPGAPIDVGTLDGLDGVVTGCAAAVAATGTLVLDGSAECGRRAITLVPDLHLVVVRAGQVVESVPEALAVIDPARPLTLVSGPSATSDIELNRVEGVHGPRTLIVVIVA